MPGAGIKQVTILNSGRIPLLDVTRLVSRAGAGPATGIDRVEAAYLTYLLDQPGPVEGMVRATRQYNILDRDGLIAVHKVLNGQDSGPTPDRRARWLARRAPLARQQVETLVRRRSVLSARPDQIARRLRKRYDQGVTYYSVGHANLHEVTLSALGTLPNSQITVLLHDTIPLDHPETQAKGGTERFAQRLDSIAKHADRLIFTSQAARQAAQPHLDARMAGATALIAPLGVTLRPATVLDRPADDKLRFLILGTIEPRKNHALLLDVWEGLTQALPAAVMPVLEIAGRRGWADPLLFHRIDHDTRITPYLRDRGALADRDLADLMGRCDALLFPSLAEGFGLPALEAAAAGLPVICSDIPAFRETLGASAVYLAPGDRYAWQDEIIRRCKQSQDARMAERTQIKPPNIPTWAAHFETVFGHG